MVVSTVSSKGQITLPARMRRKLGISATDRVVIAEVDDSIVIRKAASLHDYEGFLGKGLSPAAERRAMIEAVLERTKGARK